MLRPPRKIQTTPDPEVLDRALGYVQDAVQDAFAPLAKIPQLDGVWLRDVSVAVAGTDVRHGLVDDRGRPRAFLGYHVTRIRGAAACYVYEPTTQADATRYLKLFASAACTVDLWVF